MCYLFRTERFHHLGKERAFIVANERMAVHGNKRLKSDFFL